MRPIYLCLFLAFSPLAGAADRSSANPPGAPVLGLAFDESQHAIRPLLGIPGAAVVGDPLSLDFPVQSAAIAPKSALALAVSGADQSIHLVRYSAGISSSLALDSALTSPTRILFSPSGSAALLYQASSRELQVVTGLSATPTVAGLSFAGLPDGADPAALSDDAQSILFRAIDNTGDHVWMLRQQAGPILLPFPGALLSFRPNSQDVVSATGNGAVYLARNAGAGNDYRQVYSLSSQSNPVAVAVSLDGVAAYVASSIGVLTIVNLTDATATQLDCQCRPTTFVALSPTSIFRISDISRTPIMLFDSSSAAPRTWFVPSPPDLAGRRRPVDGRGGR